MKPTLRPIHTLLIANRGEIAVRIAKTCRSMGIKSVAVYSDADRDARHTRSTDIAIHIGPAAVSASYLNQQALLEAARQSGADAIHPGYGFLSENASFAQAVLDAGLIWVGPHPEAIAQMGSKAGAKSIMQTHGVPVVPGYSGEDQSDQRFLAEAAGIEFPLLVKASAGGGGKGMVIVRDLAALPEALGRARREAQAAFGDQRLILERYCERVRHVEFQILGDKHGNALHLFERECSLQRRYQKILEESPSPALHPQLRERMGQAAVAAAKALGYDNAGTVEFILLPDGSFYFLEVNTRLQVEHPVTEMITGLDLVKAQLEVAEGQALTLTQDQLQQRGYALELRLYAEDPAAGFLPASGPVLRWELPEIEGFRCDSGVESGSEIGTHYDPLLAKLIAWGQDRRMAFRRMQLALDQMACLGLITNQPFLSALVRKDDVRQGNYHTHFLDEHPELAAEAPLSPDAVQELFMAMTLRQAWLNRQQQSLLRGLPPGWRNVPAPLPELRWVLRGEVWLVRYEHLTVADHVTSGSEPKLTLSVLECHLAEDAETKIERRVTWVSGDEHAAILDIDGKRARWVFASQDTDRVWVQHPSSGPVCVALHPKFPEALSDVNAGGYAAPMPAEVTAVHVLEGQVVEAGQPLVVLYSMKMEHTISADHAGYVSVLNVRAGDRVETGSVLLQLEARKENDAIEAGGTDAENAKT
ncbi:MAG: biotin/lipoyl-binding protein [Bacteroidetes bacterium]|nr:biotin/lipoyl-binding protein [Bacteroidota bacterium]